MPSKLKFKMLKMFRNVVYFKRKFYKENIDFTINMMTRLFMFMKTSEEETQLLKEEPATFIQMEIDIKGDMKEDLNSCRLAAFDIWKEIISFCRDKREKEEVQLLEKAFEVIKFLAKTNEVNQIELALQLLIFTAESQALTYKSFQDKFAEIISKL